MIDKSEKSILIIEDEPDLMEFYLLFLENEFKWKNLYSALNGKDGKHILKTKEIDVVISDYQVPDYDGLELLRKMHEKRVRIPKYIFITGYDSAQFRKSVMSLGVATIIKKPLGDKALNELVYRLKIA